jgi:hypothetical protein
MSSVCCSTPEALAANRSSCSASTLTPTVSAVLTMAWAAGRAVDQGGEAADPGHARERATEGANAGAQQLRLAAKPLQPARSAVARALDALKALLAALADEISSALDRRRIQYVWVCGAMVQRSLDGSVRAGGRRTLGETLRSPESG